jgi:hypothetical protein
MIFLPFVVFIRDMKPCRRFRISLLFLCMVFRGPQRICVPARAGCALMADFGTRSSAGPAIAGDGDGDARGRGEKLFRRLHAFDCGIMRGRSAGSEEKVLRQGGSVFACYAMRGLQLSTAPPWKSFDGCSRAAIESASPGTMLHWQHSFHDRHCYGRSRRTGVDEKTRSCFGCAHDQQGNW